MPPDNSVITKRDCILQNIKSLEGARASTGLCVDLSIGVMI